MNKLQVAILLCFGCTQSPMQPIELNQKPNDDGSAIAKESDGKADAWNARNNPDGLRIELNKKLDDLPLNGATTTPAWPDTYWPTYKDSINARWQKTGDFLNDLSPAEKYDVVFNDWDPFSVAELKPFDGRDCSLDSFDPAYYENLGPLASYISTYKGNQNTRQAILDEELDDRCDAKEDSKCVTDCGEEPEDETELVHFRRCVSRCDRGGVETWWGLCHAWAPAAILEKEPLHAVTMPTQYGDITFEVGDIKALFAIIYDRSKATIIGGRCNEFKVDRDETTGRITNSECRDLNAGAFHVAMTNLLGLQGRGFVEDRTFDYEVWNQPVKSYEVHTMEEISIEEAHRLLNVDTENPSDCVSTFEASEGDYCYQRGVDQLFKVETKLHWLTESDASTLALGNLHINRYSRSDDYDYILEVKNGEIVGGEWVGPSMNNHPDFVWLPSGTGRIARQIEKANVGLLNRLAQLTAEQRSAQPDPIKVESDVLNIDIPDNNFTGVDHALSVDADLLLGHDVDVGINVDIEHTYSGDLVIELTTPNGEIKQLRNREGGSTENVQEAFSISYEGEMTGTWTLRVRDVYARDVGKFNNWSVVLTPRTEDTESTRETKRYVNHDQHPIPDNERIGIESHLEVEDEGTITELKLNIAITHTYIGDLTITLAKDGVVQEVHTREGGGEDNLNKTLTVEGFRGAQLKGTWTLKVADVANMDTGILTEWSIEAEL